jgi:hypothetical protein
MIEVSDRTELSLGTTYACFPLNLDCIEEILMDVTPGGSTKRPRAKTKQSVPPQEAKTQSQPTIVVKKSRASRKTATPDVTTAISELKTVTSTGDEIKAKIAIEAYYLAAQRDFSPGRELDDWLEAERRVYADIF